MNSSPSDGDTKSKYLYVVNGEMLLRYAKTMSRSASNAASINLSGIFPPITTPFDDRERIAWDKLEHNILKLNETDVAGYLVQVFKVFRP